MVNGGLHGSVMFVEDFAKELGAGRGPPADVGEGPGREGPSQCVGARTECVERRGFRGTSVSDYLGFRMSRAQKP